MMTRETNHQSPIFLTIRDAALVLGREPWAVRELIEAGEIKAVEQDGRRFVVAASLRSYAEEISG